MTFALTLIDKPTIADIRPLVQTDISKEDQKRVNILARIICPFTDKKYTVWEFAPGIVNANNLSDWYATATNVEDAITYVCEHIVKSVAEREKNRHGIDELIGESGPFKSPIDGSIYYVMDGQAYTCATEDSPYQKLATSPAGEMLSYDDARLHIIDHIIAKMRIRQRQLDAISKSIDQLWMDRPAQQ